MCNKIISNKAAEIFEVFDRNPTVKIYLKMQWNAQFAIKLDHTSPIENIFSSL